MHSKEVLENILEDLKEEDISVIIINGAWGIGKTHLIRKDLALCCENKNIVYITPTMLLEQNIKEICYYEFKKDFEIKEEFSKNIEDVDIKKLTKAVKNSSRDVIDKAGKILEEASKISKATEAAYKTIKTFNEGILKKDIRKFDLNEKIIILDELERKPSELDLKKVLNQIFEIKEEFKKVKIIISLNKEKLKNTEEVDSDYKIFQNWMDKISDKMHTITSSEYLKNEVLELEKNIKKILNINIQNKEEDFHLLLFKNENLEFKKELNPEDYIDLDLIQEKRKSKEDYEKAVLHTEELKQGVSLFGNIRFFYKYKRYLLKIIYLIHKNLPPNMEVNVLELNNFILEKTINFYLTEQVYNDDLSMLIEGLNLDQIYELKNTGTKNQYRKNKKYYLDNLASLFVNWELEETPFQFISKSIIENPKEIIFSEGTKNIKDFFSFINLIANIHSNENTDNIVLEFIKEKIKSIEYGFKNIGMYNNLFLRVNYYNILKIEVENLISFIENNYIHDEKIYSLISNLNDILINKKKYEYIIEVVFLKDYRILFLLEEDLHKKIHYNSKTNDPFDNDNIEEKETYMKYESYNTDKYSYTMLLKDIKKDLNYFEYLLELLNIAEKTKKISQKDKIKILLIMKKEFSEIKNIEYLLNKENNYNINLDYFISNYSNIFKEENEDLHF